MNPLDKPAQEFMSKSFCLIDSEKTVLDAVECMAEKGVDSAIITEGEKPVGVITERDILYKVVLKKFDPSKVKLREIMSTPIIKVSPETPLREALKIMAEKNIRRILVVEDDRVLGVITLKASLCILHIKRLEKQKQPENWLQKHIEEVTTDVIERFEDLLKEIGE